MQLKRCKGWSITEKRRCRLNATQGDYCRRHAEEKNWKNQESEEQEQDLQSPSPKKCSER